MISTKSCTPKQRRSSRGRNDNRPWGYQPTILAKWQHERLAKDVKAGILPKSALSVTMKIIGSKRESRKK